MQQTNPLQIGIGDLHGHLKALEDLLEGLNKTLQIFTGADKLAPHVKITFTGDYIDRGQNSRGVIEKIMALQETNPHQITTLCGNHELLALAELEGLASLVKDAEKDSEKAEDLLHYYSFGHHGGNGGIPFIKNFGDSPLEATQTYLKAMHRDSPIGGWIRKLQTLTISKVGEKKILFVHGGIPQNLENPESLEDYCSKVKTLMETRTGVLHKEADTYETKYGVQNPLLGEKSVFWDRRIPRGTPQDAARLADKLKTDYIVIGHTPQRNGKIANYGNRIFNIDVGMSPAYGENEPAAILFDKDGPHGFYAGRGIVPLLTKNQDLAGPEMH